MAERTRENAVALLAMPTSTLLLLALLVQPPDPTPEPPPPELPDLVPLVEAPAEPGVTTPEQDTGFFDDDTTTTETAPPPMPEVEQLPSRDPDASSSPDPKKPKRPVIEFDPERGPAGTDGGSFFDPGKLADDGPGGGAIVQLRGFVGGSFLTTERTNTRARTEEGNFERVAPLPFFGAGTAQVYIGAAIWADAIYARISLEYLSIPRVTSGTEDILAPARRELLVESGALEINPWFWAKQAPRWFSEGFKITAGVFIVPFGIEDEEHAAPINWFTTRPNSMTNGRVYPGTWSDIGAVIKFRPTFREHRPIRPLEIDLGVFNGDACTQTRFTDALYSPTNQVAPCERIRRPEELGNPSAGVFGSDPRADLGFLGIGPDNNQNKSLLARVSFYPLPDLQFGGSIIWGKHPRLLDFDERIAGKTTIDVPQAPSWRAGAHLAFDLDRMIQSPYPLPMVRGELVLGKDAAPPARTGEQQAFADRWMLGGYAQIAQPLYRRKRSNLPGLMLQYRIDFADPDLDVPGLVGGPSGQVPLASDPSDTYLFDETSLGHTFGLRYLVVPRFTIKADYSINREDGGHQNQLYDDRFVLQIVGDF